MATGGRQGPARGLARLPRPSQAPRPAAPQGRTGASRGSGIAWRRPAGPPGATAQVSCGPKFCPVSDLGLGTRGEHPQAVLSVLTTHISAPQAQRPPQQRHAHTCPRGDTARIHVRACFRAGLIPVSGRKALQGECGKLWFGDSLRTGLGAGLPPTIYSEQEDSPHGPILLRVFNQGLY